MTPQQRQELEQMLSDIITAQDVIARLDESGDGYEIGARRLIARRNDLQKKLIETVDGWIEEPMPY
jgi:hypothetical protein